MRTKKMLMCMLQSAHLVLAIEPKMTDIVVKLDMIFTLNNKDQIKTKLKRYQTILVRWWTNNHR